MNITTVSNSFTGYRAEIRHKADLPSLSTLKKHLRKSRASDCISATKFETDGQPVEIVDMGKGAKVIFAD